MTGGRQSYWPLLGGRGRGRGGATKEKKIKGQDPSEGLLLLLPPCSAPCRCSREEAEGQPTDASTSMRETLCGVRRRRCCSGGCSSSGGSGGWGEARGWGLPLSWGAGQVTMSAPWSVRERAFWRKLSLKDSICSRKLEMKRGRREGEEGGREGSVVGGGGGAGQRDSRIRCLEDKKPQDGG